ncbi:MAG: manganese efflux pump [Bacteriovoracaceae bacterium]|nr:manganese efflux pump [Bacteriovoracaceae bacterium]
MGVGAVILIAFILSLDAFAVSISCGIKLGCFVRRKVLKIALYFAIFQAVMPLLGWWLGDLIRDYVESYSHYLSFIVFFLLGLKTIYDGYSESKALDNGASVQCVCKNNWCLLNLAVATSIDAFVIGLLFSVQKVPLLQSIIIIGVITFIMSIIGTVFGGRIGATFGRYSCYLAGFILLLLAAKSLLQ